MLVAILDGDRVLARDSEKGFEYHCPGCNKVVTLKKGTQKIHHFAHKPPVSCIYASGETEAHLESKQAFYDHFKSIGFNPQLEYPLEGNGVKARADLYMETSKGLRVAFEMQHTNISPTEIAQRTENYSKLGIAVLWIPIIDLDSLEVDAETESNWVVHRYSPKPFEKWIHGFNFGEIWFFEPKTCVMWKAKLSPYVIEVEYKEWYDSSGGSQSAGGYTKKSKRWKRLDFLGCYALREITFSAKHREAGVLGSFTYPEVNRVKIEPKRK